MPSVKRIKVSQIVRGMYVQRLDGSWLSHPFWRRSFLVEIDSDVMTLRESAVTHVWIDTDEGLDLPSDPDDASPAGESDGTEDRGHDAVDGAGDAAEMVEAAVNGEAIDAAEAGDERDVGRPEPEAADDATDDVAPAAPDTRSVAPARPSRTARRGARHLPGERDWDRAKKIRSQAREVVGKLFEGARSGQTLDTESARPVIDAVIDSVSTQPGTLVSLTRLKNKDDYTFMHSVSVCALMTALAIELGLDDAGVVESATAGLMHDIGKMAVDPDVLNNPGKLNEVEFDEIKRHTTEGHRLLVEAGNVSDIVLDVCRHHHERIDGNGYPDRLKDEQISLFARMGTVCDVYDAITSDRPYKKAWQASVALQYMARWAPGAYDPLIFHAFVRSLGVYPNGSLVNLASGRIAIVVEQSQGRLLAPVVKVFHSSKLKVAIAPELIDLSEPGCSDRIVARVDPAEWGFGSLDHLWMPA